MHETIIVGSGPAGAAAALKLAARGTLVLDTGIRAPAVPDDFSGRLYELKRSHPDLFQHLVGPKFESLTNLFSKKKVSLKLKSPYMNFIIRESARLAPIESETFEGVISLAEGGLANGWGGGVFRYTDEDLQNFPLTYRDLKPHYDELNRHIGICGQDDALAPWLTRDDELQDAVALSRFASVLLARYTRRQSLFERENVHLGRSRLAVLTRNKDGRGAYAFENMEFFRPHLPAIYTPAFTMRQLVERGDVDYRSGWFVERFDETSEGVRVFARNVTSDEVREFCGRRLLLGAGALNTGRIVLKSAGDTESKLPLLDNPMSCIPFFNPQLVGRALQPEDSSLGQLSLICGAVPGLGTVQAGIYGGSGPLRSDVIFDVPLAVSAARTVLKYTGAATGLVMLFYPGRVRPENYVRLTPSGALEVGCESEEFGTLERRIIRLFRRLGYLSHPSLVQYPPLGTGLHYAGLLPMRHQPARNQCGPDGRLAGSRKVFVIDGACFSDLPAKNLTFTIMANAMRIAELASKE